MSLWTALGRWEISWGLTTQYIPPLGSVVLLTLTGLIFVVKIVLKFVLCINCSHWNLCILCQHKTKWIVLLQRFIHESTPVSEKELHHYSVKTLKKNNQDRSLINGSSILFNCLASWCSIMQQLYSFIISHSLLMSLNLTNFPLSQF